MLTLDSSVALWLVPEMEVEAIVWMDAVGGGVRMPDRRYCELASAQKIYFDALSISHDIRLERAFDKLGFGAPTREQAERVFRDIEREVAPTYAFEASSDGIWHIRNQSTPDFSANPLHRYARWVLFVQCEEKIERITLDAEHIASALAWLPLLDGHHTAEEVEAAINANPYTRLVGSALNNVSAFVPADQEQSSSISELPEMLFVSHSSVFVRGERGGSILIDPAILSSTEMLSRAGRRPFSIASHVDAVIVSHCHWDHLSFQTMIRIPRSTAFYVPKSTSPSLANPPIRRVLEAFGFTNIHEVSDWDTITLGRGGDIEVTFVPFFGEPFGLGSRFNAFTYLIRASGKTIYGSLDACHDEAGNMDPVIDEIAARLKTLKTPLDIFLFGSSAQKHDPLYRGANLRHYSNELTTRPDLIRYHPNIDDVLRWSHVLKPQTRIPYANFVYFGAQQHDDEELHGNSKGNSEGNRNNFTRYWESAEIPPFILPWKSELARLIDEPKGNLLMLHPMQGLRFFTPT